MTVETDRYTLVISPDSGLPQSNASEIEKVNDEIRDCMQIYIH